MKLVDFINYRKDKKDIVLKTDFKVPDLKALQDFFKNEVKPLTKTLQGKKQFHGGWSIQSDTGDFIDGWQPGSAVLRKDINGKVIVDLEKRKQMFPNGFAFDIPTEICKGPTKDLIVQLYDQGFAAKRTRFSELNPGHADTWHFDNGNEFWRGHIAIETDYDNLFRFRENGKVIGCHIPADGYLYLVNISLEHSIINAGKNYRTHIITDSSQDIRDFKVNVESYLRI
jgi:hypothetical protein